MVPAMLSGLGLRGGGRGRIATEEDVWLDAADCSEATDRDERGRDGDGCSFPAAREATSPQEPRSEQGRAHPKLFSTAAISGRHLNGHENLQVGCFFKNRCTI